MDPETAFPQGPRSADYVTPDTVMHYFQTSPIANRAVYAQLSKDELILLLLEDNERLQKELAKVLHLHPPTRLFVDRREWDAVQNSPEAQ